MIPLRSEALNKRREALIQICKEKQGEYVPAYHGSGSWATTYSNEFIAAVKSLGELYRQAGYGDEPLWCISHDLQESGILSCRGKAMTQDRVRYLWGTHIASQ